MKKIWAQENGARERDARGGREHLPERPMKIVFFLLSWRAENFLLVERQAVCVTRFDQ